MKNLYTVKQLNPNMRKLINIVKCNKMLYQDTLDKTEKARANELVKLGVFKKDKGQVTNRIFYYFPIKR